MNEVVLSGWIYKEPRITTFKTEKGESKCSSYMIFVENGFDYHKKDLIFVFAYGTRAEWVEKYLKPNTKIIVKGFLNNRKTKDENGNTVYKLCVIASRHEFASYDMERSGREISEAELQSEEMPERDENAMIEQFLISAINDFYDSIL